MSNISILGAKLFNLHSYEDERGVFNRLYESRDCLDGSNILFEQIRNVNHSINPNKGTLRGMHMQRGSFQEAKIIRCIRGSIIDIFIYARSDSPTFGKVNTVRLTSKNSHSLLIPRGCFHGFLTIEEETEIIYFVDNFYSPDFEVSINPTSPNITKHLTDFEINQVSDKDLNGHDFTTYFYN